MATSYKSRVEYKVMDTSQMMYSFPFPYLRKAFISVSVLHADSTEEVLNYFTDYTVTDLSITLVTPLIKGDILIIERKTSTDKVVTWNDGSILLSKDMNLENTQLLHLLEEQQDYIKAHSIRTENTESNERIWDAASHRISNVADPTDAQDAVTKHYMENVQGGFVSANTILVQEATKQATAAKSSQESAKASATQANESERSSLASANLAEAWATSTTSPDNITDAESTTGKTQSSRSWALFSKTKAQEANTSATNAKASETNAKASETNADVSATNAKTAETNAKISERTSSDSASASASSASAAATSATNAKASETKALASENNAKTSETKAAVSANNAKDSETNASASAEAASSSEANALASEVHARNSAQTASTSATNAKTSETNAKTSETNAKTSETNASDSEMSARASEINARYSETNAANSAKQAAESAGVFQDFTGATADTDGTSGKVPKPLAGEQGKFLKGDGTWGAIDLPSGNFVTTDTPQTITGLKTIDNKPLVFTGKNSFIPQQYQCAIYKGTADDGVLGVGPLNLTLQTWYGVSIVDSCIHKAPTIAFDARTGRITTILGEAVLCSSNMQILNIYIGNLTFKGKTERTITFEHPFDTVPHIKWLDGNVPDDIYIETEIMGNLLDSKASMTIRFTEGEGKQVNNVWGYIMATGRRV